MVRRYDNAHTSGTENFLDTVLAGEHVTFPHIADYLRAILCHIPPFYPTGPETLRVFDHTLHRRSGNLKWLATRACRAGSLR